MIKTKFIEVRKGTIVPKKIDELINDFLEETKDNIEEVIDIKFQSNTSYSDVGKYNNSDWQISALIIYKEKKQ